MTDDEFLQELTQAVVRRGAASHLVDTLAFVAEVAERLEEDPVFGEFTPVEYSGSGARGRALRVHGFTQLDASDGTIGLVIGKWEESDAVETLTTAAVNQLTSNLQSFVEEAVKGDLSARITESNAAYELATELREVGGKISRVRLHIFSNGILSQRFKEEISGTIAGVPIERHIWDLQRLRAMYESSMERETVSIKLKEFKSEGIPCIEASRTEKLKSYLCVVKGSLLADLFERYGSRLLEGNVRSFLGMKGGVNKGIRTTIQDTPSLFFAYNNGIAATASGVTVSDVDGRQLITALTDLQIVNGGQTTASVLSARKKDGLSLDAVTVQMKLTEVERSDANELIPKIAQFANTQNRVAIADFFANHPFHIKMEEISRRLQVPAKAGVRVQSKWFYERSRGQFQNARLYLTKAKKDAFDLEYPSGQVINKTDLAKLDSVWEEKPHWVSLGAQKNFMKFAGKFAPRSEEVSESEYWIDISPQYGDPYYKQVAALALLWKAGERIVSAGKDDWYEGDYRPQIVAYALVLLLHTLRARGKQLDLNRIWLLQGIDGGLEGAIRDSAKLVQANLLAPPDGTTNVGEWCKKEACWTAVQRLGLRVAVDQWSVSKEEFGRVKADSKKQGQQDDGIAVQKAVLGLVRDGYWAALAGWGKAPAMLTEPERALLSRASTTAGFLRINTERDWRKLLEIKQRCEDEGFRRT
jgi:hypothetical protein